jgi:aryl-alcohol dehydrogenase-like predicted oxidoreductase
VLTQRPLGNTGIKVSLVGLGLAKLGRNTNTKYPHAFELPSDASMRELLAQARDLGVTLLDTAPAYGTSEERLGKLLQDRQHWVLCTKAGEEYRNNKSHFDFTQAAIEASVERSLQRLCTDHLDLVLIHSNGDDAHILQTHEPLATLARMQTQGKLRSYGFSGKTLQGGRLALSQGAQVLMLTINATQRDGLPLIAEAAAVGAGVLIKKPLGSGHLDPGSLQQTAAIDGVSSLVIGTLNTAHLRQNIELVSK